jgi:hypothetical protein
MLKRGHNARAAVRHLQLLTSCAFEAESFARQAENYEGWATAHGTGHARHWYRDALEQRGYDVRPLAPWCEADGLAPPPDDVVPLLLKALRDKDWFVQRNASFLLNLRLGAAAPDEIDYATAPEEAEKAIRAYHSWWNTREAERRKREEG